jgi:hypothetical protein
LPEFDESPFLIGVVAPLRFSFLTAVVAMATELPFTFSKIYFITVNISTKI